MTHRNRHSDVGKYTQQSEQIKKKLEGKKIRN